MPVKIPPDWIDDARAAATAYDAFKLSRDMVREVRQTPGLSLKSVLALKIVEVRLEAAKALNEMQDELIEETKS